MKKANFEWIKWIPVCLIAILLMVIYKTLDNMAQITSAIGSFFRVISPLLYGVLFAYFLFLPHRKIEQLFAKSKVRFFAGKARGFSTITIFLLLVLVIIFLISVIVPILITSVIDLARSIPTYLNYILGYLDDVEEDSIWYALNLAEMIRENTGSFLNQYVNLASIEQMARGIISLAGELFSLLLGLIVSLYLLLERERIVAFFGKLITVVFKNEKVSSRIKKYLNQVNSVLFTFIASKGLDSVINLICVTSILLIFKVPYAFLLGLIAGLFNFIPYLGSLVAVIFISLITLITGGVGNALKVVIPLLVFQQLDGNYIEPRIMKSSLKISPILVIIAVVVGGAYFGIVGMFLAVPTVAIIKQIMIEYVDNSEKEDTI